MGSHTFEVHVASGFSNQNVRELSETEVSLAKAMGLSEEQFKQSKIDYLAKEERARARGRELGEIIQRFLNDLENDYKLSRVTWNRDTLSWRLEIATPAEGIRNIVVSWELADDALDSRSKGELQRLKNILMFGLHRRDQVG